MKSSTLAVLCVTLALAAPAVSAQAKQSLDGPGTPPPSAQDQNVEIQKDVHDRLVRAADALKMAGYFYQDMQTGRLRHDQSGQYALSLAQGHAYAQVAVCDDDCSDMDLLLRDAQGRELDRDLADNGHPILMWHATGAQDLSLRVDMDTCAQDPCIFALGLFRK